MSRGLLIALVVIAVLVVGIGLWAVSVNNQLVVLDQNVGEKWAQVQNVYQRRADLIPNLVETVKGFAAQERTVLEEVTRARASASSIQLTPEALNDPKALEKFQAVAEPALGRAVALCWSRSRNIPTSNPTRTSWLCRASSKAPRTASPWSAATSTEAVRDYNTRLRLFPGSIIARFSGYQPKAFFEAAPDAATVPKVKF